MNYLLICFAVAAGICIHIIYQDIIELYYPVQYNLSEESKDELVDMVNVTLTDSVSTLVKALDLTGDWLVELQQKKPIPKGQQLTKDQWLDQAIYYATREDGDQNE